MIKKNNFVSSQSYRGNTFPNLNIYQQVVWNRTTTTKKKSLKIKEI